MMKLPPRPQEATQSFCPSYWLAPLLRVGCPRFLKGSQFLVLRLRSCGEDRAFQDNIQITPEIASSSRLTHNRAWGPHVLSWIPVSMEIEQLLRNLGTQKHKLIYFHNNTNAREGMGWVRFTSRVSRPLCLS